MIQRLFPGEEDTAAVTSKGRKDWRKEDVFAEIGTNTGGGGMLWNDPGCKGILKRAGFYAMDRRLSE